LKISRTHTIFEIILVLVGVLLSLIFLNMSMPYWLSDAGWYIKLIFSFFVASFISSAIGMICVRLLRKWVFTS